MLCVKFVDTLQRIIENSKKESDLNLGKGNVLKKKFDILYNNTNVLK